MEQLRIIIADNQPETRSALRLVIELEHGFTVVGEADEAGELTAMARTVRPDIVLLDWQLRDAGATAPADLALCLDNKKELVLMLHAIHRGLKVLALSGRPEAKKDALSAGADAFVSKGESPDKLMEALRSLREYCKK